VQNFNPRRLYAPFIISFAFRMFIGEYSHSVDEKGRVSVPAKFRQDLATGVVVTRGLDHCLFVYPRAEWEIMASKLASLPISQKKSRAFARLMLAGAWDAMLDGQGRVILPEYLRQYAGISKQVVVAGLYNRVEIWDEDAWQEYKAKTEAESDDIAEAMGSLGV
jgi:MraZ protein